MTLSTAGEARGRNTAFANAKVTLAEAATSEIHRMILSGELAAGQPLRINDLAQRLALSGMPVREALRRLEARGLVEIVPHRGARVRELSKADLRDTFRTRIDLESLATVAAARDFSADTADTAARWLEEHERLIYLGEVDAARDAHKEFHFTIYRASGSRWLVRAIEPVWQNSERYRFAQPQDATHRRRAHYEHAAVLEACVSHDPEGANEAIRGHIEGAMERILHSMRSAPSE